MPDLAADIARRVKKDSKATVPPGGATGRVLTKTGPDDYDTGWQLAARLPTGGAVGDVLTKTALPDGAAGWVAPAGAGGGFPVGGQDQFQDFTGVATSTTPAWVPWVPATGSLVPDSGNLIPDTLAGNAVASVATAGLYVVHCSVALIADTDTQARVAGAVIQVGTGLIKALDADIRILPATYDFGGVAARLTFPFVGEVGDVVFVQATLGSGGPTGDAKMIACAFSMTPAP